MNDLNGESMPIDFFERLNKLCGQIDGIGRLERRQGLQTSKSEKTASALICTRRLNERVKKTVSAVEALHRSFEEDTAAIESFSITLKNGFVKLEEYVDTCQSKMVEYGYQDSDDVFEGCENEDIVGGEKVEEYFVKMVAPLSVKVPRMPRPEDYGLTRNYLEQIMQTPGENFMQTLHNEQISTNPVTPDIFNHSGLSASSLDCISPGRLLRPLDLHDQFDESVFEKTLGITKTPINLGRSQSQAIRNTQDADQTSSLATLSSKKNSKFIHKIPSMPTLCYNFS